MADRDIGRALRQQVPDDGGDVEVALGRVRRAGRRRVERRRRLAVAAPVAVAVVTAVVVLLVVRGAGGPSAPPAVSPTGSPTATASPATGAWFRHVAGIGTTAPLDIGSVWVVRQTSPTRGTFDVRPDDRFGRGTFHYDAARRAWVVDVLARYCDDRPGLYTVTHVGGALLFTKIDDPCAARATVLGSSVFARLTSEDQLNG